MEEKKIELKNLKSKKSNKTSILTQTEESKRISSTVETQTSSVEVEDKDTETLLKRSLNLAQTLSISSLVFANKH